MEKQGIIEGKVISLYWKSICAILISAPLLLIVREADGQKRAIKVNKQNIMANKFVGLKVGSHSRIWITRNKLMIRVISFVERWICKKCKRS